MAPALSLPGRCFCTLAAASLLFSCVTTAAAAPESAPANVEPSGLHKAPSACKAFCLLSPVLATALLTTGLHYLLPGDDAIPKVEPKPRPVPTTRRSVSKILRPTSTKVKQKGDASTSSTLSNKIAKQLWHNVTLERQRAANASAAARSAEARATAEHVKASAGRQELQRLREETRKREAQAEVNISLETQRVQRLENLLLSQEAELRKAYANANASAGASTTNMRELQQLRENLQKYEAEAARNATLARKTIEDLERRLQRRGKELQEARANASEMGHVRDQIQNLQAKLRKRQVEAQENVSEAAQRIQELKLQVQRQEEDIDQAHVEASSLARNVSMQAHKLQEMQKLEAKVEGKASVRRDRIQELEGQLRAREQELDQVEEAGRNASAATREIKRLEGKLRTRDVELEEAGAQAARWRRNASMVAEVARGRETAVQANEARWRRNASMVAEVARGLETAAQAKEDQLRIAVQNASDAARNVRQLQAQLRSCGEELTEAEARARTRQRSLATAAPVVAPPRSAGGLNGDSERHRAEREAEGSEAALRAAKTMAEEHMRKAEERARAAEARARMLEARAAAFSKREEDSTRHGTAASPVGSWFRGFTHQRAIAAALGLLGVLCILGPANVVYVLCPVAGSSLGGLLAAAGLSFFFEGSSGGGPCLLEALGSLLRGEGGAAEYIVWGVLSLVGMLRWLFVFPEVDCSAWEPTGPPGSLPPKAAASDALEEPLLRTQRRQPTIGAEPQPSPRTSSHGSSGREPQRDLV